MEECSLFNVVDDVQLFALHSVIFPNISWITAVFMHSGARNIIEGQVPDPMYGVDEETLVAAPQTGCEDDIQIVKVVSPHNPLQHDDHEKVQTTLHHAGKGLHITYEPWLLGR